MIVNGASILRQHYPIPVLETMLYFYNFKNTHKHRISFDINLKLDRRTKEMRYISLYVGILSDHLFRK